jgi:hypothetical protein
MYDPTVASARMTSPLAAAPGYATLPELLTTDSARSGLSKNPAGGTAEDGHSGEEIVRSSICLAEHESTRIELRK